MNTIYDYEITKRDGSILKLSSLKNKVILIVNTATGCGFTPQYKPIEELYKKYHDKGLEIIDIPCNQFGSQAPGSDNEIHNFCQLHYNTTFDQMKKGDVNGENELPIYTFLKSKIGFSSFGDSEMGKMLDEMLRKNDPEYDKKSDIKWNFTKFLINKNGEVVKRFEPTTEMDLVEKEIKNLL